MSNIYRNIHFLWSNGKLKYCNLHSQVSNDAISVDVSVTVAEGSTVINSVCIFIWQSRKIFGPCQDFVYISVPAMAASIPL